MSSTMERSAHSAESAMPAFELDTPHTPGQLYVLKHGDTFIVNDARGDIAGIDDGLFRNDTRVLSFYKLSLGGAPPSSLGAAVSEDNTFFTANATNRPLPPLGGQPTPEGVIHLERKRFVWQDRLYERLLLVNYGELAADVPLVLGFDADFHDTFEVRGQRRAV